MGARAHEMTDERAFFYLFSFQCSALERPPNRLCLSR
jgi:hypothetical protein